MAETEQTDQQTDAIAPEEEVSDAQLDEWFETGREALRNGQITRAHQIFGQVAAVYPSYPLLGHAMACSLPNSFLVHLEGQIDARNASRVRDRLGEIQLQYRDVRLLLIDFSANHYLTSPGIEVLVDIQRWPHTLVKLIEVHPRPKQILQTLKLDRLVWDEASCPICGPDRECMAKFARRRRHPVPVD